MSDLLQSLVDLEIIVVCVGLVVFVVSYMSFFNWRKTSAGRSLLFFVISLLALVCCSVIRVFTGSDSMIFAISRGIVYTTLVFTTWHMVRVLWTSYHRQDPLHFPPVPAKSSTQKEL